MQNPSAHAVGQVWRMPLRGETSSPFDVAGGVDQATRLAWLRQYGDFTLAYATAVEPGLSHFSIGDGYVAFRKYWRYTYVLGDPVAPRPSWQALIDAFLCVHPGSVFCQISADAAECLVRHRYWINEMGVDTCLSLGEYSFRGKEREKLRYANNWLLSHGYRMAEVSLNHALAENMQQLIDDWKATRVFKRDVGFLNRAAVLRDEVEVRKICLWDGAGRLQAFLFLDPLFRDGEIVGYVTSIKRRHPAATPYAEMGITKWVVEMLQNEGLQSLWLGLSPLAGIENQRFRHVRPMHYSFRWGLNAFWINRYFYNLSGHAAFKRRFGGREIKTHYASPVYFNDLRLIMLMRMMGFV